MRRDAITTIFGKRRSGKSRLLADLLEELEGGRILGYDPMHEYTFGTVCVGYPAFLRYIKRNVKAQNLRAIYRPLETPRDARFSDFCDLAWSLGSALVVIDEGDIAMSATQVPPAFLRLVEQGRHREVGVVLATRRPASIPRNLTSSVDTAYVGRMTEPRDKAFFREAWGPEMDAVENLGAFEFLRWQEPRDGETDATLVKIRADRSIVELAKAQAVTVGEEAGDAA